MIGTAFWLAAQVAAALPTVAGGAVLHAGDRVPLVTTVTVSSKSAAVGDRVPLVVSEDVRVAGHIVIPQGTPAMGEVALARAKGAFGQSGQIEIRPLYVTFGDRTIRLEGGGGAHGTIGAGGVIGIIVLTPGISGRSAIVPAGSAIPAVVLHDVALMP